MAHSRRRGETSPSADTSPAPRIAFALDANDDVAAFDPDSGAVLATYEYGGLVTDLCWDRWRKRVAFAQIDGYVDGSRVYALTYDGTFTHRASSPGLPGELRLACTEDGVLAISDEHGIESWWTLLDDELMPVGESTTLPVVASVVRSQSHWLTALDVHARLDNEPVDAILDVDEPGGAWSRVRAFFPADGPYQTRIAAGADPDDAWLLRRPRAGGAIDVAHIDLAHPAGATLRNVAVDPAAGELEDVLYLPSQRALVALVDRDVGAALYAVPVVPGGLATDRHLDAHARSSAAVLHALALDPVSGHVLVASAGGVSAFAQTLDGPAAFTATELRPPLALP